MGASNFSQTARGKTAKEAFAAAVQEAQYEHGHGGYSGTLAEKHSYVEIAVPAGEDPRKFAERLMDEDDKRIEDKWGPAGCVKLAEGEWLFFGFASS